LAICNLVPAQEKEPSTADLLNAKAKELFAQEKYAEAIELWEEAFRNASIDDAIKLAKNLAVGYKKLDQTSRVFYYFMFRYALTPPAQRDEALENARKVLEEALNAGKGLVKVTVEPGNALVTVKEENAELTFRPPFYWYFRPGAHNLAVSADGMRTEEKQIPVAVGQTTELHVVLRPVQEAVWPPTGPRPAEKRGRSKINKEAAALLVVGLTAVAAGAVLDIVAVAKKAGAQEELDTYIEDEDLEPERSNKDWVRANDKKEEIEGKIRRLNNIGNGLLIGGGVVTLGTVIGIAVASRKRGKDKVAILPSLGPGHASLSLGVSF
jgi:tetratricopeptide (TPR) repeat protein